MDDVRDAAADDVAPPRALPRARGDADRRRLARRRARATVVLLRSTIALLHDSASLVQEAWRARAASARSRAATIEQQPPASPPTPLLEVPAQRKRGRPRSADGKKRAVISVPFFGFARPKTPPPPQLPLISSTRLII